VSRKRTGRSSGRPAVVKTQPAPQPQTNVSIHQESHEHRVDINTTGIPSFRELAGYEETLPGAADRIFVMAEDQARHRRKLETKVIGGDDVRAYVGMGAGAVLQTLVIGGTVYLGSKGQDRVAIALIASGSVPALTTIWANWKRSKERAGRAA